MSDKKPISLYIHIPFCRKRCGYCDFNTYVGLNHLLEKYIDCVLEEIVIFSTLFNSENFVQTIYFGGGTPTIMPVSFFEKIINTISDHFTIAVVPEISTEANPKELKMDYLSRLHDAGINRLSIGMQSAVIKELEILERLQNPEDVSQAVFNAKQAGFKNISLDLSYRLNQPFHLNLSIFQFTGCHWNHRLRWLKRYEMVIFLMWMRIWQEICMRG